MTTFCVYDSTYHYVARVLAKYDNKRLQDASGERTKLMMPYTRDRPSVGQTNSSSSASAPKAIAQADSRIHPQFIAFVSTMKAYYEGGRRGKYRSERDELERSRLKKARVDDDRRGWLKHKINSSLLRLRLAGRWTNQGGVALCHWNAMGS
jgi:hypothetical protein